MNLTWLSLTAAVPTDVDPNPVPVASDLATLGELLKWWSRLAPHLVDTMGTITSSPQPCCIK